MDHIDARYIIQTHDGATISLFTDGYAVSGDVFRERLFFTAGKRRYRWLNSVVALAVSSIDAGGRLVSDAYVLRGTGAAGAAPDLPEPGAAGAGAGLPVPQWEYLYYIEVDVDPALQVGRANGLRQRIIPITGGRFEGERLSGTVAAVGADWNTMYPPARSRVSTRYLLETDDGAVISLWTDGRMKVGPRAVGTLMKRGRSDPDATKYYFRQHLFFKTGDPRYAWLNSAIAFAVIGMDARGKVCYDAFMLI